MRLIAAIAGSAALAFGPASSVPPPPAPGAWHQLGASMTSRPGKGLHFFRTVLNPQALGVVVTSSSSRRSTVPVQLVRDRDDDGPVEELRGRSLAVKTVIAYPHVLSGATRCYVSVYTIAPGPAAKTAAAEFSY